MHLCHTPANATLGELWKCDCGQLWFFGIDFGARTPEWFDLANCRRGRVRAIEVRASANQESERKAKERKAKNEQAEHLRRCPWDAPSGTNVYNSWYRLPEKKKIERRAAMDAEFAQFLKDERADAKKHGEPPHFDEINFLSWKMRQSMARFREATRQDVLLELTAELLQSSFSLGDGTQITWGEATATQHEQRFNLLVGQATGTVRAAQRHRAAVKLIQERKAACLNEVAAA